MIHNQVFVFLWSILTGAILALIFDFFRLMRRKGNTKNIIVYIQDVIFWILAMLIIVASAFITNNGELRGYMFIGYGIGAIFYILLFSKLFLKTLGTILDILEKIFKIPEKFYRKIADKFRTKKKNVNF